MAGSRRWWWVIIALALAHGAAYIVYQQPDWDVSWTDQGGYRTLAHGLAASGTFTRFPGTEPFVPESIRTPGYPLFVATVYRIAGESHMAVAVAQVIVFAVMCLLVTSLGRRVMTPAGAVAAGIVLAAYAPLPYFAALMLTELWTTFVLVVAMLATWKALETSRPLWFAVAGALCGYVALSRPVFVLLAPYLAVFGLVLFGRRANWRQLTVSWGIFVLGAAAMLAPWFAYNHQHFGIIGISPVGIGRPVFESSWQGIWPGRVQAMLTDIADSPLTDEQLAAEVTRFAAERRFDAPPMLTYVRQWRDIRKIWVTPTDPEERARARIIGQNEYLRVGLVNIRQDLWGFLRRRVVPGQFVLWAADIPVRYSAINQLSPWTIRMIWLPQGILFALACIGAITIAQRRRADAFLLLVMPLVYVGAVHFVMLTESRQSLPVKPLLIVLAVVGAAEVLMRARGRSELLAR